MASDAAPAVVKAPVGTSAPPASKDAAVSSAASAPTASPAAKVIAPAATPASNNPTPLPAGALAPTAAAPLGYKLLKTPKPDGTMGVYKQKITSPSAKAAAPAGTKAPLASPTPADAKRTTDASSHATSPAPAAAKSTTDASTPAVTTTPEAPAVSASHKTQALGAIAAIVASLDVSKLSGSVLTATNTAGYVQAIISGDKDTADAFALKLGGGSATPTAATTPAAAASTLGASKKSITSKATSALASPATPTGALAPTADAPYGYMIVKRPKPDGTVGVYKQKIAAPVKPGTPAISQVLATGVHPQPQVLILQRTAASQPATTPKPATQAIPSKATAAPPATSSPAVSKPVTTTILVKTPPQPAPVVRPGVPVAPRASLPAPRAPMNIHKNIAATTATVVGVLGATAGAVPLVDVIRGNPIKTAHTPATAPAGGITAVKTTDARNEVTTGGTPAYNPTPSTQPISTSRDADNTGAIPYGTNQGYDNDHNNENQAYDNDSYGDGGMLISDSASYCGEDDPIEEYDPAMHGELETYDPTQHGEPPEVGEGDHLYEAETAGGEEDLEEYNPQEHGELTPEAGEEEPIEEYEPQEQEMVPEGGEEVVDGADGAKDEEEPLEEYNPDEHEMLAEGEEGELEEYDPEQHETLEKDGEEPEAEQTEEEVHDEPVVPEEPEDAPVHHEEEPANDSEGYAGYYDGGADEDY